MYYVKKIGRGYGYVEKENEQKLISKHWFLSRAIKRLFTECTKWPHTGIYRLENNCGGTLYRVEVDDGRDIMLKKELKQKEETL